MLNKFRGQSGFTIAELLVAGAISVTMMGVGFSIVQIALRGNKIDETQMGLSGRLNDTLDFILDEVKVGKRIIDNESEIKSLNSNCTYPSSGDFLFGIRLPDQALVKADYDTEGDQLNLNQVECPIVYTLRPSNSDERMPNALVRYGPQYNEKGYYISPSYQEFQETVLLDGITSTAQYEKIICPPGWNDIKTIKGITLCIDEFKKAIEIQIQAEDIQNGTLNTLQSLASIGGFSSIQDENQVNLIPPTSATGSEVPICMGGPCCWMGVCLKSNKVTYMIDRSYLMNEDYDQHPNGLVVNGEWTQIINPALISPRINGQSLILSAKSTLKQHINRLLPSNEFQLQIIAFDISAEYLFSDGPQVLTDDNKIRAISFLDQLSADVQGIEPWNELCKALESDSVGQVILLSASTPSTTEGSCVVDGTIIEGNYAEIIDEYNRVTRSKTMIGALIIDSISLFHNFCESSKNYANNNWLGLISGGAESVCTHIK